MQLAPWNEFLMSFILHVANASLTVFKVYTERNELIQVNSSPCCVCPAEPLNCSHNWLTQKLQIRSRSQWFKTSTYLAFTCEKWVQVIFIDALLQGESSDSTLGIFHMLDWTKQPFHHDFFQHHSWLIQLQSIASNSGNITYQIYLFMSPLQEEMGKGESNKQDGV